MNRPATQPPAENWHALPPHLCLARLGSGEEGLSPEEAQRRLDQFGPNLLQRQRADGPLRVLWRQIDSPLIWVLLASGLLAVAVGKVTDGLVVLAVVALNSAIGFVQEYRAGRAIEALSAMAPEIVTVLRAGRQTTVAAPSLVRGDIVLLAAGDKIPADLRLLVDKGLRADEATLTGESLPVDKSAAAVAADAPIGERCSMAFAGTLVTAGTATGVVVATGNDTELGHISGLLQQAVELQTPLTRALAGIGRLITAAVLTMTALMLAIGVARATAAGVSLTEALRESLIFAIALAVGAIPEGLPAIVTIALAIGVQRMAARSAIIRKLPAVETLGSTTVICSDKTGTLTRNEMSVAALWTPEDGAWTVDGAGYVPEGGLRPAASDSPAERLPENLLALLRDGALCNDACLLDGGDGRWSIAGDPTEAALLVVARKAGLDSQSLSNQWPRRDALPFAAEYRFMATLNVSPCGTALVLVKGAPEAVLSRCLGADAAIHAEIDRLARAGMRVLALARKDAAAQTLEIDDVTALHFTGLVGMMDAPRPEAVGALQACRSAGIEVKMITGDHLVTARAIARQLGLDAAKGALAGNALAQMDDASLAAAVRETAVFARVAPEHKLRLVRALQAVGQVVAMTGDGVNDAPALKQADIGVAMGITGTAVSKEAADVVLADDNFASIVAAVEEGRRVYDNLVKSLAFVLPTNLGLALILTWALLFFPFDLHTQQLLLPVQPTQILWINLVATVALALPLAFEAKEPGLMARPPRDPRKPVLSRFVLLRTLLAGLAMTASAVGLFRWEYAARLALGASPALALAEAQTMAVTAVIAFQIFYLLTCRSLHGSLLRIGVFSNPWIFSGIAALLLLQAAYIYAPPLQALFGSAPLDGGDLLLAAVVGAAILPVVAAEKALRRANGKPTLP